MRSFGIRFLRRRDGGWANLTLRNLNKCAREEFDKFIQKEDFRLFFASDLFSMLREHREVIIFLIRRNLFIANGGQPTQGAHAPPCWANRQQNATVSKLPGRRV